MTEDTDTDRSRTTNGSAQSANSHTATCRFCGPVAQNTDRVLVEARADEHEGEYGHSVTVDTDRPRVMTDGGETTGVDSPTDREDDMETREVEMRQFTAVTGFATDDGYRFRLTKPLGLTGLTIDDLRGDTEAILYLGDPDPDRRELTGALVVGEDLPGGRRNSRYRRIRNNRSSLTIYLKNEEIEAIGVDVDGETPPVLDVWASEDGMAFRPLDVRELVIEKDLDHGLEALPDQMREDYLAVEEWGYTPAEWAEERGLTPMEEASGVFDPAAYVERNVKAAKRQLDADDSTD